MSVEKETSKKVAKVEANPVGGAYDRRVKMHAQKED